MAMNLKACRDCGAVHPVSAFPRYSGDRGFRPMCRECFNAGENVRRQHRRKFGARPISEQTRHERFREKFTSDLIFRCDALARSAKQRASKKRLGFNLTGAMLFVLIQSQSLCCAKTGTPFDFGSNDDVRSFVWTAFHTMFGGA